MASGLPIIATPAGGVVDHLRHGINGLAFAANDVSALACAMLSLAMDRSRARQLGSGARFTAESLSWESERDRLDASYREVLALSREPDRVLTPSLA